MTDGAPVGQNSRVELPIRSMNTGTCLFWRGGRAVSIINLCPLQLRFLGSSRPAAGLTSITIHDSVQIKNDSLQTVMIKV